MTKLPREQVLINKIMKQRQTIKSLQAQKRSWKERYQRHIAKERANLLGDPPMTSDEQLDDAKTSTDKQLDDAKTRTDKQLDDANPNTSTDKQLDDPPKTNTDKQLDVDPPKTIKQPDDPPKTETKQLEPSRVSIRELLDADVDSLQELLDKLDDDDDHGGREAILYEKGSEDSFVDDEDDSD